MSTPPELNSSRHPHKLVTTDPQAIHRSRYLYILTVFIQQGLSFTLSPLDTLLNSRSPISTISKPDAKEMRRKNGFCRFLKRHTRFLFRAGIKESSSVDFVAREDYVRVGDYSWWRNISKQNTRKGTVPEEVPTTEVHLSEPCNAPTGRIPVRNAAPEMLLPEPMRVRLDGEEVVPLPEPESQTRAISRYSPEPEMFFTQSMRVQPQETGWPAERRATFSDHWWQTLHPSSSPASGQQPDSDSRVMSRPIFCLSEPSGVWVPPGALDRYPELSSLTDQATGSGDIPANYRLIPWASQEDFEKYQLTKNCLSLSMISGPQDRDSSPDSVLLAHQHAMESLLSSSPSDETCESYRSCSQSNAGAWTPQSSLFSHWNAPRGGAAGHASCPGRVAFGGLPPDPSSSSPAGGSPRPFRRCRTG